MDETPEAKTETEEPSPQPFPTALELLEKLRPREGARYRRFRKEALWQLTKGRVEDIVRGKPVMMYLGDAGCLDNPGFSENTWVAKMLLKELEGLGYSGRLGLSSHRTLVMHLWIDTDPVRVDELKEGTQRRSPQSCGVTSVVIAGQMRVLPTVQQPQQQQQQPPSYLRPGYWGVTRANLSSRYYGS